MVPTTCHWEGIKVIQMKFLFVKLISYSCQTERKCSRKPIAKLLFFSTVLCACSSVSYTAGGNSQPSFNLITAENLITETCTFMWWVICVCILPSCGEVNYVFLVELPPLESDWSGNQEKLKKLTLKYGEREWTRRKSWSFVQECAKCSPCRPL